MKFDLGLSQKLALEQRLTPQLILNLKLLQLPALELEELVKAELEQNPVLESADDGAEQSADAGESEPAPAEGAPDEEPAPADDNDRLSEGLITGDVNIEDFFPDEGPPPASAAAPREDGPDIFETACDPGPDLRGALMPQLRAQLPVEDAMVAEAILEALNEDGLLTVDHDELAASQGVSPARLRQILSLIQHIEPGGLACRDQQEAFLVQLELHGCAPDCLESRIVAEHWQLLLQAQVAKIARKCGVGEEEVRAAIDTILTLEPKPARRYSKAPTEYVVPDFSVVWRDDRPVAEANDTGQPRLRLARRYVEMLRSPHDFPKDQVRFAREKFNRALMFLRGIESRRRTLRRLMELILEEQGEFFRQGPQFLRPATLRAAAGRLGVHPSTASRATQGKYVETQYGIFPLKYFFKSGAGDHSRASIKQKIRMMIEAEDHARSLSDDEICAALGQEGIKVARRTVAKYRGELDIPGRNQRNRL